MSLQATVLDEEHVNQKMREPDMRFYRLESDDGKTCYVMSKKPPEVVDAFYDADERPHTVDRIVECSAEELKAAWDAIDARIAD